MSEREYQGNGIRAVAVLIDMVVWAAIGYVIAVLTGQTTGAGFDLEGLPAFVWFLSYFGYYIVLEGQFGQTVGKMAAGIEVVTESGEPIGYRTSLIRNVLRVADGLFFYLVGAIFVLRSDSKQRLGDRVGETYVVAG